MIDTIENLKADMAIERHFSAIRNAKIDVERAEIAASYKPLKKTFTYRTSPKF